MSTILDRAALGAGAAELGVTLSAHQLDQFENLFRLLQEWNARVNLTSIEAADYVTLHFLDSLTLYPLLGRADRILDVGTGPGFPALPLAIALPGAAITALDSIRKKLDFTKAVAEHLRLSLELRCERAEQAAHDAALRERFDAVVSRAVAELSILVHWTVPFVKVGGIAVAMKGNDVEDELRAAHSDLVSLGAEFSEVRTVTIPGTTITRSLVVLRKISETPPSLPKRGNIKKRR